MQVHSCPKPQQQSCALESLALLVSGKEVQEMDFENKLISEMDWAIECCKCPPWVTVCGLVQPLPIIQSHSLNKNGAWHM